MYTYVYLVRHGESPKSEKNEERTRGLTDKGVKDAIILANRLVEEGIDIIISSPYRRSILTVQELAYRLRKQILIEENLKERIFSLEERQLTERELLELLSQSFENPTYTLNGAESNYDCQNRGIATLTDTLEKFQGQKIVFASHGVLITQILGFFDQVYNDLEFLWNMDKPAVFSMKFMGKELLEITRL